jgi:hypothetical protein
MNVMVPLGTDVERLRAMASTFRGDVPAGRLIVTFFPPTAGPERFVIGHMPSGGEPLIADATAAAWLARFDVP